MRIPRKHAMAALKRGDAFEAGLTYTGEAHPRAYVILDRYDHQRVDHYPATEDDVDRLTLRVED